MDVSRKRRMSDEDDISHVDVAFKRLATPSRLLRQCPTAATEATDAMMGPSQASLAPATAAPAHLAPVVPPPRGRLTSRRDVAAAQALRPAMDLSWQDVQALFVPSGKFTDVVVENTTLDDWRRVLLGVEQSSLRHQLYCNGEPVASFQHRLEDALAPASEIFYRLHVWLGDVELRCCLMDQGSINFDLGSFDVRQEHDFDELMKFVSFLGLLTGKPALVGDASPGAVYWHDTFATAAM